MEKRVDKMRKYAMISIVLGMLIAAMDSMILNTTLPQITEALGGYKLFAWITAAFLITSTVTAPLYGKLSDIYGRKKVYAWSVIVFLIGSVLCGIANSMLFLVIARAIQGIGAGGMMPLSMIIAGDLFPIEKRGKIQALFTAMWGISAVAGPLLGGLIVMYTTWRWVFFINVPIVILILIFLQKYKDVHEAKPRRIDYLGAVLFLIGVSFALATTVLESQTGIITAALIGIALLLVFAITSIRNPEPFIPFKLFRNPMVSMLNITGFLATLAMFGASSFIPLYLQQVLGLSTIQSGLVFIGQTFGWMLAAVPAGKYIVRWGYRMPLIVASVILSFTGWMLFNVSDATSYWYVAGAYTLQGFAMGMIITVTMLGSQEAVAPHLKGISTSIGSFARNIGGTIGVTIMGTILFRSADILSGTQNLFLFGFIASLLALVIMFFVPHRIVTLGTDR